MGRYINLKPGKSDEMTPAVRAHLDHVERVMDAEMERIVPVYGKAMVESAITGCTFEEALRRVATDDSVVHATLDRMGVPR